MCKAEAINSIQIGTLIQTGCDGRWNRPCPVSDISARGTGVYGAYVVLTIADVHNLRDGKVWSWTTLSINERGYGKFSRIATIKSVCMHCKAVLKEGDPERVSHGICDDCFAKHHSD